MATENQGIMSLPQGETPQAPQLGLEDSYDAVRSGLQDAAPQADVDLQAVMAQITPMLDQLSDEQLDQFLRVIQYLHDGGEGQYAKRLKEVEDAGALEPDTLPDEYDPEILAAIGTVLLQAQRDRRGSASAQAQMPEPPVGMARGGIAEAARMVAAQGRGNDTMLAHVTPKEAKMLRKKGGAGTINPRTGLPEYDMFSSAWQSATGAVSDVVKGVTGAVKGVLSSPVGRILATVALATFLGPGAMGITGLGLGTGASMALASGAITALGGGNVKDILRSAATGYLASPAGPLASYLGPVGAGMGITSAAGQAALNAGLVGTGVGLLTGQKLSDAVKSGLVAGAIQGGVVGATQGFGAQAPVPGQPAPAGTQGGLSQAPIPDEYSAFKPTATQYGAFGEPPVGPTPPASTSVWDTLKSKISPSEIQATGAKEAMESVTKQYGVTPQQVLNAPAGTALANAYKAALPGVFSTYGPAVGLGLGITGLMGGFQAKQPQPSALASQLRGTPGEDLIKANPSKYLTQNIRGVTYDEKGNITGSTPGWTGGTTMDEIRVSSLPSAGLAPLPIYTPMAGSLGSNMGPVLQPYNTASLYDSYFQTPPPRYYAGGGIADMMYQDAPVAMDAGIASLAQGGYPRRTGQISGPGTEKSDSIPAMLSDGEFVMTAKAVRGAGNGSRRAGAKKMYALMHQLERNASRG